MDVQGSAGRSLGVKDTRWYGLTVRRGTVLAGAFSILATHLYLIFEQKHLAQINCTQARLAGGVAKDAVSLFIICWSLVLMVLLSLVTLAVSGFLLYAVYAQVYLGALLYVLWIPLYEGASLAVQVLTSRFSSRVVRVMRWFGLLSRLLLHCFWLTFVTAYARLSYSSQPEGNILAYSRRGSTRKF
ncbi:transmembrane protein 217 [Cavia porcellus]|uniref:Transmembrane protein 217 n=1 Tax=Cavia porcellus TaxID=10141 RepID=H0VLW9_CAVPO|nr:transmembrane protein 217 [Cavia porcellus]